MPSDRQLPLGLRFWGGRRKGAGRKRKGPRPMVPHTERLALKARHPVHITMRVLPEIPSLRAMHRVVRDALVAGSRKEDGSFRLIHYAILSNHLHLIVEASDAGGLSRGMQSVAIRIAWAVNRAMGRKRGKVFSDRYHDHQLKTPRETRNALFYVVNNFRRHMAESGGFFGPRFIDRHSTARYLHDRRKCPLPSPETWLLSRGYVEGGGEIDLSKVPGQLPKPSRRGIGRA